MDVSSVNALIAGASGVGGGIVGAGATILADARAARRQRLRAHDDALIAFWTAVGSYAHLWSSMSEVLPRTDSRVKKIVQGVQIGGFASQFFARQFTVADAFWLASGRVRTVATRPELEVVDVVEKAVGDWTFGEPMPDSFLPALRQLRTLVQSLGPARLPESAERA